MRIVVLIVILHYITINATVATADTKNTLALQWPTSVCKSLGVLCEEAIVMTTGVFTIHGLWPNVKPLQPEDPPCQAEPFEYFEFQIKNSDPRLMVDLEYTWPSLNKNVPNEKFWRHEWEVHGACTEPLMGLKEYFEKTTKLFRGMYGETALDILQNAGITLESSFSPTELIEKMKKMRRKPAIACVKLEGIAPPTYAIVEAQFCVNEAGTEIIDCLSAVLDASCPSSNGVIITFPAQDSSIQNHG